MVTWMVRLLATWLENRLNPWLNAGLKKDMPQIPDLAPERFGQRFISGLLALAKLPSADAGRVLLVSSLCLALFAACQPANNPLGNETPSSPGIQTSAKPNASSNEPRSLNFVVRLENRLLKGFATKQSLADCAEELTDIRTTLIFPTPFPPEKILNLRSQGLTVSVADGNTTVSFVNTLIAAGASEQDLAYTFNDLPAGIVQGTTTFKNNLQQELGFVKYTVNITAQGSASILLEMRSAGGEAEIDDCPEIIARLSGGTLTQTSGDILAYVPPTPTPRPSGSSSPSSTPTPLPSLPAGPTPVPLPSSSPATEAPTISSLSALSAAPLDEITITGGGFTGVNAVRFGNVTAYSFEVVTATEIKARVPRNFTTGYVNVSNSKGIASYTTEEFTLNETPHTSPSILYVKQGGTGDGSSWANAMGDLNAAMYLANESDSVWVQEGTYKPTSNTDRAVSFNLRKNVTVMGGFAGTESAASERVIDSHPTILSGDLSGNDNYLDTSTADLADNSVHVVKGGTGNGAVLDGLTIQGGNANSHYPNDRGGGMYLENVQITLNKVRILENRAFGNGAGIFNGVGGTPIMTDVSFNSNIAGQSGGGIYNAQGSLPSYSSVTFAYNEARQGGGVYHEGISPIMTTVNFLNNKASFFGGGMYNRKQASPIIIGAKFENNKATAGGAMYNVDGASPEISVATFSGNEAENGAALYNYNESSPIIKNTQFLGNIATFVGGGMYNYKHTGLAPAVTDSVFAGNRANQGAGMANRSGSAPKLTNVVFTGNIAAAAGGGIYNYNRGNPRVIHGTFSNNQAPSGAELYAGANSNPALTSTVMWNETLESVILLQTKSTLSASSCSIKNLGQIEHAGFGNLDIDPYYVNSLNPAGPDGIFMTSDDGLRLSIGSPALNYGVTAGAPTTDILGVTRTMPPEMGAYEGSFEHVLVPLGIEDILEGTGLVAEAGDTVSVDYIGTLIDGREFDNSYTRGTPYTFVLGAGTTIQGWDQGIPGMKMGGKRKLTIPPHLAYGANSVGIIPPNATLLFEVELVNVQKP